MSKYLSNFEFVHIECPGMPMVSDPQSKAGSSSVNWYEEKSAMTGQTIFNEINCNINIIVLNYFVRETIRTELGFTVVHLGFEFLVVTSVKKRRII